MIAVIVAAGLGSRLSPLTDEMPKCMLPLAGKPILRRNLDVLRAAGVGTVYVVTGYKRERIDFPDIIKLVNEDYRDNNILFSLMHARRAFAEAAERGSELLVSYSDIVYDSRIVEALRQADGDIALVGDADWRRAYIGRSEHPEAEAEKMIVGVGRVVRIGKHLGQEAAAEQAEEYEFIGLCKLSARACREWLQEFDALCGRLDPLEPFLGAAEFRKSYLTHFLQHLIHQGRRLQPVVIRGGWREFDTRQDYENLERLYASGTFGEAGAAPVRRGPRAQQEV